MQKNKKVKGGFSVMTAPFIIIISMGFMIILTIYMVNAILPFIWYQKMQLLATKYMYIIEKYGYLTNEEKVELINDMQREGFMLQNVQVECPEEKLIYGTLFKFAISYKYNYELPNIINIGAHKAEEVVLRVEKYSYSKN